jgi:hypothetical protein
MSHSTQVRVQVGNTTIEYTFGTGVVASQFGLDHKQVRVPKVYLGFGARALLDRRNPQTQPVLPDLHLLLAREELANLDALYEGDIEADKQLRITITRFD